MIVYTTKNCPNCDALKVYLEKRNKSFIEKNIEETDVLTELVMNDVAMFSAPIVLFEGRHFSSSEIPALKELL